MIALNKVQPAFKFLKNYLQRLNEELRVRIEGFLAGTTLSPYSGAYGTAIPTEWQILCY